MQSTNIITYYLEVSSCICHSIEKLSLDKDTTVIISKKIRSMWSTGRCHFLRKRFGCTIYGPRCFHSWSCVIHSNFHIITWWWIGPSIAQYPYTVSMDHVIWDRPVRPNHRGRPNIYKNCVAHGFPVFVVVRP